MYRSIYTYENKDPSFLAFNAGDVFNLIEQIDGHSWSVNDEKGNHGLVPATYLEVNNITEEEVLYSIDKSIESISKKGKGRAPLNNEQRRILQKLITNRQMVAAGESLWSKASTTVSSSPNGIPNQPKRQAPKAPGIKTTKGRSLKRNSAPAPPADINSLLQSKSVDPVNFQTSQSSIDEGASSKIYNIVVNNGNSHLPVNSISPPGNQKFKNICKPSSTAESGNSSCSSDKDSIDSSSSLSPRLDNTGNPVGISEIRGKNFTISRTNNEACKIVGGLQATNFIISKSNGEKDLNRIPRSQSVSSKSTYSAVNPENRTALRKPTKRNTIEDQSVSSLCSQSLNSFSSSTMEVSITPNVTMGSSTIQSVYNKDVNVSETLGKDLIDIVRSRCKLSFNKSLAAVRVILHTLGGEVPDIKELTDKIRDQIIDDRLSVHRGSLAVEDSTRLHNILACLTEHKEDSQQRNWAVHEDFEVIKELLDDLIQTMGEIDPSISRSVLREDEYRYINDLIVYYQMEHRSKLRVTLLHVFGCFCELGAEFITQLLCSVLPTELALDIMQDQKDIMKFLTSCLMLTMVFSTGESVPYNHYVQFNETFINFVLDTIEDPPDGDVEDQVSDALVGVLLSFNQHFKSPKNNVVLKCISKRKIFRTLSEKVLLLVNRGKDPVAMFDFVQSCPDSVMKLLIDLFASKNTSGIFFTNDLMVLIDIVLRQITDRPVKDKTRTEYLSLFHSLLNTTNYSEHRHHAADFKRCFADILANSELESPVDIYIVKEITKRFADVFE